ncbi:hemophore [Mycobacterium angelicum]|uniref:Hemophore n=1 Tax=Mycobacterium angelicum TaxID=470074 RepID=A0A1W9ZH22_MYCAN|nr:hemophore [Mycobacterium angelicum]MCV7195653.1 hemophore [Mycobacterium angelicum]ORA15151.1 hemophore [Mycobacterium angelicum]
MKPTVTIVRRGLLAALIAGALPGVWLALPSGTPSAQSATDPCAASEVARTVGSVAKQTGDYLDAHPETNQAMTAVLQQPGGPQSLGSLKSYFDTHPKVASDLQGLSQPLTTLSGRCKLPIALPQALGLAQAAQGAGGLPGVPGAIGGGTAVSPPAATAPVPGPAPAKRAG